MAASDPKSSATKSRGELEGALEVLGRRKGVPRRRLENMSSYIDRLTNAGVLDKQLKADTTKVRLAGNRGAHNRPVSPIEAKITVELTATILKRLHNR